jgi:hypothetical protein
VKLNVSAVALSDEGLVGFELADHGSDCIALGLLLRPVAIERGELGPIFFGLLGQKLPLHGGVQQIEGLQAHCNALPSSLS